MRWPENSNKSDMNKIKFSYARPIVFCAFRQHYWFDTVLHESMKSTVSDCPGPSSNLTHKHQETYRTYSYICKRRRVNDHRHYKMQHLSRICLARLFLFFFPFFSLLSSIFLARISLMRSKKTCNQDSTASWKMYHFNSILNCLYYQWKKWIWSRH